MLVGMNHDSYSDFWGFISEYLPNYSSRDDVLKSDILRRFLDEQDLSYNDFLMILGEYKGDKESVKNALIELEVELEKKILVVDYNEDSNAENSLHH